MDIGLIVKTSLFGSLGKLYFVKSCGEQIKYAFKRHHISEKSIVNKGACVVATTPPTSAENGTSPPALYNQNIWIPQK